MNQLKEIVSIFTKKSIEEINENTNIDRNILGSSILVHRLFAELSKHGYNLNNYKNIKTFGELLSNLNIETQTLKSQDLIDDHTYSRMGVDIENISSFEEVVDFREDAFYIENFTNKEISYCCLKSNPRQSFAGLFCVKEAICKIDNRLSQNKFNQIEILYTQNGKPYYPGYEISISHTNTTAIAIAMKIQNELNEINFIKDDLTNKIEIHQEKVIDFKIYKITSILSLLISLIALIIILNIKINP